MAIRGRFRIIGWLVLVGAVLVTALTLPTAASAWFRNAANARIARAAIAKHPAVKDSQVGLSRQPDREASRREWSAALDDADAQLAHARGWSNDALVALAQARAFLVRGEASRVVETLRATGMALQDDFIAQFVWGEAEWQVGNPAGAYERWRAAGALDYFVNQSLRAGFKHDWQAAEKYARCAVGIAPERAETHYLLGDAIGHQAPENPQALREIERAAKLTSDPEFLSTILSRKGELLAAQGRDRDALAQFEQARQIAPRDARPRIGYAVTSLRIDPSAEAQAIEVLMQVVNDAPWTISAHLALAKIAESHHDLKSAEEWYRAALTRDPNNPDALFAMGEFYARHNRIEDAKKTLTLALKYESHLDDQHAIARALAELNAR